MSCKQRCLFGQIDEAGVAPLRWLAADLDRGLTGLALQLMRYEAIRRQLPQQLVQALGLSLIHTMQIEMARAPGIGRQLAGEPLDGGSLRVIRLTHQVKGHLAHQVGSRLAVTDSDWPSVGCHAGHGSPSSLNETRKRRASSL
ncbi:hypothetical protein D3C84_856390 [compost metagenome]